MENIVGIANSKHGIDLSCYEDSFLRKAVEKRIGFLNCSNISRYSDILINDKREVVKLSDSLNIGYSEFFRNPLTFAMLEQLIIPRLLDGSKPDSEMRVWSAGCASGQESYSIAMMFDEFLSRKEVPHRFRVFGTDVSEPALARARQGIYETSDVQNISLKFIDKYFTSKSGSYTVCKSIREKIDFSHFDLLDPRMVSPSASIFGDFDLIFCCNILFYYKPEIRPIILNKLYQSLSVDGFLVTGEAEREIVAKFKFRAVAPPAAVFQKAG